MYKTGQKFNISENIGSKFGGSEEDFLGKIQKELTTNYEKISCKLEKDVCHISILQNIRIKNI